MRHAHAGQGDGQIGIRVIDCNAARHSELDALVVFREILIEELACLGRKIIDALVLYQLLRMSRATTIVALIRSLGSGW